MNKIGFLTACIGLFSFFTSSVDATSVSDARPHVSCKRQSGPLYKSKLGAGFENKGSPAVSLFSSMTHAFQNCSQLRNYVTSGQKSRVKKKLKSLFHLVERKKKIKLASSKKLANTFFTYAKKAQFGSINNTYQMASFFLKECGVPPISYVKKMEIAPSDNQPLIGFPPKIVKSYAYKNRQLVTIDITEQTKACSISDLLSKKRTVQNLKRRQLDDHFRQYDGLVPKRFAIPVSQQPKSAKFDYTERVTVAFKDKRSVPAVLPIYLNRIFEQSDGQLSLYAVPVTPSKTVAIPIKKYSSTAATFSLASVIALPLEHFYYAEYLGLHRTYVPRPKNGKKAWALYSDSQVKEIKDPLKPIVLGPHKFYPLGDIYRHGLLYMYEFTGFKKVKKK